MCCCGQVRIIQTGGAAPFTFSITGGNSPYNGGLGVITGPIVINNNDIVHFFSANTIDFNVTPGSVNVGAEVRLDPNPLNTLSSSVAGLMGNAAAYSFDIGHNVGANYTINNGDTWKVTSGNNTLDTVNLGGLITGFNVRIDPNPTNAITTSIAGIYVPAGGVNIYNSDGTITDPTRTVTIGNSYLLFDAQDAASQSNIYIDKFANNIFTYDAASQTQNTVTTDLSSAVMQSNNSADNVARYIAIADGTHAELIHDAVGGMDRNSIYQYASPGVSYIDLNNSGGNFFELRLNGDPGLPGQTIISNGPGGSPIWGNTGAGGSFGLAGDIGASETVTVSIDTLAILGGNLISTTVSPSDTITVNILPGANGQVMYTIAGTPTWAFLQDILNVLNFTTDVNWNFGGNDWNVTNADNINITSNTFNVNSPVVCFPGITQNNALTRHLVMDLGGCLAWSDAVGGGGGGPIPINDLLAADGTNNIDNAAFNQTWRWDSLTNGVGLQLQSSSITTGSLMQLSTNQVGANVGRLANILSMGATTGFRGMQITTNDSSTEGLNVFQTGQGRALRVETSNAGPGGTGAPLVEFERTNAASSNEIVTRIISAGNDNGLLVTTAATSEIVSSFNASNLTKGVVGLFTASSAYSGANLQARSTAQHTGQVLDVQSTVSTQAFANGGARFFFGGNHTGSSVLIDSGTTAGNALEIISAVTTGNGLDIDASSLTSGNGISIDVGTTDGRVYINFDQSGVQQGSITNGAGNTVLYNTTSDRRLKENIVEAKFNATKVIDDIEVVEYNFKSDHNKTTLRGMIAQDLYEVYPEAVAKGDDVKTWGIDYSKLVPILLKSIQELNDRIKTLESK